MNSPICIALALLIRYPDGIKETVMGSTLGAEKLKGEKIDVEWTRSRRTRRGKQEHENTEYEEEGWHNIVKINDASRECGIGAEGPGSNPPSGTMEGSSSEPRIIGTRTSWDQ